MMDNDRERLDIFKLIWPCKQSLKARIMVVDSYEKEVARKVIHVFALVYLACYFFFAVLFSHQIGLLVLGGLLALGIIIESLRLQLGVHLPLIGYLYNFRRQKELEGVGAEIYFLLGVIVSLAVFETAIAVAAILMTVFGDLTAALVGKRWGRLRLRFLPGKKSIEGFAAALAVNVIIGVLILRVAPDSPLWWRNLVGSSLDSIAAYSFGPVLWPLVAVMSFVAALTELTITKVNDNLAIPVISGFAGQITLMLLRYL
jgi:phytol kinase